MQSNIEKGDTITDRVEQEHLTNLYIQGTKNNREADLDFLILPKEKKSYLSTYILSIVLCPIGIYFAIKLIFLEDETRIGIYVIVITFLTLLIEYYLTIIFI